MRVEQFCIENDRHADVLVDTCLQVGIYYTWRLANYKKNYCINFSEIAFSVKHAWDCIQTALATQGFKYRLEIVITIFNIISRSSREKERNSIDLHTHIMPRRAKMQYIFTLQVNRCCFLALCRQFTTNSYCSVRSYYSQRVIHNNKQ